MSPGLRPGSPTSAGRSVRAGTFHTLSLVAIGAACSGGRGEAPRTVPDAGAAARPAAAPDAGSPAVAAPAITVEEVKAVVPVPAESRVITPHQKREGQERVTVAFCFDRVAVEQVAGRVSAKLVSAGWTVERKGTDLHATQRDLRLDGMVRRGPWAGCLGEKGQTYVALGVYR